ncbi:MAG: hypothetical protein INR69_00315 [Mucilaginibacter polytrichastri]|nr:hypothetical protein [Mucilaginibacter polytrichastri]
MKFAFFFCMLCVPLSICAQGKTDTVFLMKETKDGNTHSVYIDPAPAARIYESLAAFPVDTASYNEQISWIKSKSPGKWKTQLKDIPLPRKWVEVKTYRSKMYLYRPCDMSANTPLMFTDSTVVFSGFEIGVAYVKQVKKLGENSWELGMTSASVRVSAIRIRYFDQEKGLAEFAFVTDDGGWKEIMVDADRMKAFPVIVHDCPVDRWPEFVFEP